MQTLVVSGEIFRGKLRKRYKKLPFFRLIFAIIQTSYKCFAILKLYWAEQQHFFLIHYLPINISGSQKKLMASSRSLTNSVANNQNMFVQV